MIDPKIFYRDEDGFFYCGSCGKDLDSVRDHGHGGGCPHRVMSAATFVLLIPARPDPHGLCKEGPFGGRGPIVQGWACIRCKRPTWWTKGWGAAYIPRCSHCDREDGIRGVGFALIVQHRGEVVRDGLIRLVWALEDRISLGAVITSRPENLDVLLAAAEEYALGEVLRLDGEGVALEDIESAEREAAGFDPIALGM